MDIAWLLIAGLSMVALALESWLRCRRRSGRRTTRIGETTRTPRTDPRSSPGPVSRVSAPTNRRVLSEGGLAVMVSASRGRGQESGASNWPPGRTLETATVIRAPAGRVWRTLSDFASYPHWNPYICRIIGEACEGSRIEVSVQPPGRVGLTCWPKVVEARAERALRWRHRLFLPGVLDHEHQCLIEPLDGNAVRLVQREIYTGILVPLLPRSLDDSTVQGFRAMHEALRAHTEAVDRP